MKLTIGKKYDVSVHFVPSGDDLNFLSEDVRTYAQETFSYKGQLNEVFTHLGPKSDNILVVGLGKAEYITRDHYVKVAHKAAQILEANKISEANFNGFTFGDISEVLALEASVEGVLQASYNFQEYKSKKKDAILSNISFISDLENADEVVKSTWNVLKGIDLTRDLVNTPANDLYPETLADKVNETFQDTAVEVEIFDKAALQELGAEAILAVSQGSSKEPRMIVLKYMPLGPDEPVISLVGKGVTYDSGGYALKTARGMATMMTDMAGAAAMIGTVQALAANDVQKNVIAVIGATENLISGEAFKNGDIINTLKGTTVEVLNTDAEGRLVLADVLYYAATEFKPSMMIDAATLTGAVIAALGKNMTGALTNNQELLEKVLDASKLVGEDMWQLPITDEFREKMKGNNADLANAILTPVGAGTISAAAFLENFVEDVPWVHLDIAGTSYAGGKGNKYLPKGASGVPVKTLYHFIKNLA